MHNISLTNAARSKKVPRKNFGMCFYIVNLFLAYILLSRNHKILDAKSSKDRNSGKKSKKWVKPE